ncbi:MAG: transcription antitermination factor NusB [Rhizobacter sp.]
MTPKPEVSAKTPGSRRSRGNGARNSGGAGERPAGRSGRRRSRELVLQGLYQWLLSGSDLSSVKQHIREQDEFDKCDMGHFDAVLSGCIENAAALDQVLVLHLDRPITELSPVEHGILLIAGFELQHCLDIPYKVVINEAVELAKSFGGTDGHKYVNGVLDKAAVEWRTAEVQSR